MSLARIAAEPWLRRLPAVVLVLLAAGIFISQAAHYDLLGHDSYPIIAASRVQSFGDFVGTFTESLMDGRYISAFYRPLLNLSFALDYALWGLAPLGFQLTNVLLFALCALALYALAARLAGGDGVVSYVTLLAFLLHPSHVEVIPVPARRPELLVCLLFSLTLWLQLSPRALRASRWAILPAVTTLAAIAAKETGFVLPVLSFVAVLLYAADPSWRGKLHHASRAVAPQLVAVVVMLGARAAVLGGLGGHRPISLVEALGAVPGYLTTIARELIVPQPVMRGSLVAPLILLGLTLGLVLTGILLSLFRELAVDHRSSQIKSAKILVVALSWILLVGVIYATAGWLGPWYYLLPVAGWALLTGGLAERFTGLASRKGQAVRWPAAATLIVLAALLIWHASYSPLVRHYDEWRRATLVSRDFLDETRRRIEGALPGSIVNAPPLPFWVEPKTDAATVFGGAILDGYSVQAWADLTLPEFGVTIRMQPGGPPAPPDRIVLLVTSRQPGY